MKAALTGFLTYTTAIAFHLNRITRWRFTIILGVIYSLYINSVNVIEQVEKQVTSYDGLAPPFKVPGPQTLCTGNQHETAKTIVFIESTGHECLTPRQACGVESAAKANPDMKINIHVNTFRIGIYDPEPYVFRDGRVRSCALNKILPILYKNVNMIKENFIDRIRDTNFWQLIESRALQHNQWSDVHLSDIMRLIFLNETGGIYLDFDNIVFRPLDCLRNTFSYLKEAPNIENGIMAIDAGHPFLKYLMNTVLQNYEPGSRATIGPPTFGKAFKSFCNQSNLTTGTFNCSDNSKLTLIDPDAFFPVKHNQHQYFYLTNFEELDLVPMKKAFLTHVYLSSWGTEVHKNSLYARLARQYCPSVWKLTSAIDIPLGF